MNAGDNMSTTYMVHFDRIGRNHSVPPLIIQIDSTVIDCGDAPGLIAENVYRYAKPRLLSRDVEVSVDMDSGRGALFCGFQSGGQFTIATAEDGVK